MPDEPAHVCGEVVTDAYVDDCVRLTALHQDVRVWRWEHRGGNLWRTRDGGPEGRADRFVRDVWLYILLDGEAGVSTEVNAEVLWNPACACPNVEAERIIRAGLAGEIATRREALVDMIPERSQVRRVHGR